jgi:outer membrane receptor for ferrienterochelin and colicins
MNLCQLTLMASAIITSNSNSNSNSDESLFGLNLVELMAQQVVVAASGFEQKTSQAPATVTVITAAQWQLMGARHLTDVLATVPGFHIGKPPIDVKHTKFVIRGLSGQSSSQIKVLIDGEPFEFIQDNGLFSGFEVPLTSFERIEVVKGPGSAIYGADAFGVLQT